MTNNRGVGLFHMDSTLYYVRLLVEHQMGLPFFILFLVGISRLRRQTTSFHANLLLLWLAGLYVLLVLVPHKVSWQGIGFLLPIGLISALGLSSIARFRRTVTAAVLLYGVAQFATLSLPPQILADRLGRFEWAGHFHNYPYGHLPTANDWKTAETLTSMDSQIRKIAVLADHEFVNGQTFVYYNLSLHLPYTIVRCRDQSEDFMGNLATYDAVITKSDWVPSPRNLSNPRRRPDMDVVVAQYFNDHLDRFYLYRKTPLPDGSELLIYRPKTADRQGDS